MTTDRYWVRKGETVKGPFGIDAMRRFHARGQLGEGMEISQDGETFHGWERYEEHLEEERSVPTERVPTEGVHTEGAPRARSDRLRFRRTSPKKRVSLSPEASLVTLIVSGLGILLLLVGIVWNEWVRVTIEDTQLVSLGGELVASYGVFGVSISVTLPDPGVLQGQSLDLEQHKSYGEIYEAIRKAEEGLPMRIRDVVGQTWWLGWLIFGAGLATILVWCRFAWRARHGKNLPVRLGIGYVALAAAGFATLYGFQVRGLFTLSESGSQFGWWGRGLRVDGISHILALCGYTLVLLAGILIWAPEVSWSPFVGIEDWKQGRKRRGLLVIGVATITTLILVWGLFFENALDRDRGRFQNAWETSSERQIASHFHPTERSRHDWQFMPALTAPEHKEREEASASIVFSIRGGRLETRWTRHLSRWYIEDLEFEMN